MKHFLIFILVCLNISYGQDVNWKTVFENSEFKSTSSYEESINYFNKLADYSEYAKMIEFGVSPQGRKLYCFIAAGDKEFAPGDAKKSGKPIILINNGIHSGEIEGKDASALLLREILVSKEKEHFIDDVILMIIPIHNVDGHERKSKYNRINQNGPEEMGWRTTAQNLNLNRDFLKADAPEMKAWIRLFSDWTPDLLVDVHTTNGADYQYTITYSMETYKNIPDNIGRWTNNEFLPVITKETEEAGYLTAPYMWFRSSIEKGFSGWVAGPRYSNGYAATHNRAGLLIETHMLKPYKDRVLGTKAMFESVIKYFNDNASQIVTMNKKADEWVLNQYLKNERPFPIKFGNTEKFDKFDYKGFKQKNKLSKVAGTDVISYTDEEYEIEIPFYNDHYVVDSIQVPLAYFIPAEWSVLVDVIRLHGVEVDTLKSDQKLKVKEYKFSDVKFTKFPYEGRFQPAYKISSNTEEKVLPAGTFKINTDQRTLPIIVHLLEPKSDDSFVKWGFMNQIFERKEYFEMYSMNPIAEEMYKENEELRKEFLSKVESDEKFRNNPRSRMNFFYERSKYYDQKHNVYPILRMN